jgi:hypothetical protein
MLIRDSSPPLGKAASRSTRLWTVKSPTLHGAVLTIVHSRFPDLHRFRFPVPTIASNRLRITCLLLLVTN